MGSSWMMSGVRRKIDVREHVFQIGPEFRFRRLVMVKSVMDKSSKVGNKRLHRMVNLFLGAEQRFRESGLQGQARVHRETGSNNVNVCALHICPSCLFHTAALRAALRMPIPGLREPE